MNELNSVVKVNPSFEYQDHMILKIWDTYIKQKKLSYYYADLGKQQLSTVPSLASRSEMSFDLLAGLVINNDNTLYRPRTYSLTLCGAIDFLNNTANARINAITAPLEVALHQIRLWQNTLRDNPIREHVILFPYHATSRHWNCGNISVKFNGDQIIYFQINIYEPWSSYCILNDQFIDAIKAVFDKNFKINCAINKEFKYTKQQQDTSSCGAISAENGKDIIDGQTRKINDVYPSGAHALRLQHINEVNCKRFYDIQLNDEIYVDPQINFDAPWQSIQIGFKQLLEKVPEEHKVKFIGFIEQFKKNADYTTILANKISIMTPLIPFFKNVFINQNLTFFDILFKNQDLDLANNGIDTLERLSGELAIIVDNAHPHWQKQTPSYRLSSVFNQQKIHSIAPLPALITKGDKYNKTKALIPGLEGVTYQVAILMQTAFESFERGEEFELLTEAADFEKFDDIVKHCKNPIEETVVTQVKHGHASDCCYTLNDFISDPTKKGKKVQLSKYFDSWLKIRAKMPNRRIVYQLISNYDINIAIEDKNFNKNIGEFSQNFIDNKDLTEAEQAVRSEIFNKMKDHAEGIEAIKLLDEIRFDIDINQIKQTIEKIVKILQQEHYDAKGVGETKKWIRSLLANYISIRDKDENYIKNNNHFIDNPIFSCVDKSELDKINEAIKIKIPLNNGVQGLINETVTQLPTLRNNKIYRLIDKKYLQVIILLSGCLERSGDNYKFKHDFIYDNKLTSLQQSMRKNIIECVQRDFPKVLKDKNITDEIIKQFLREFKLKTKFLSVQELDKTLKTHMAKYFDNAFPGHYEAFYLEILTWLRDYSYSHNNKTIETFFNIFKARLPWQDLIGITKDHIERKFAKSPILFDKSKHQFTSIGNFLASQGKLLIICCCSGITNSLLMRDYLLEQNEADHSIKVGQYLFIKAKQFFEHNNPEYYLLTLMQHDLKLIIFDAINIALIHKNQSLLSILLEEAAKKNKQIILLVYLAYDYQFEMLQHNTYIVEQVKKSNGKIIRIPQLDHAQINVVINNFHIDREITVLNRVVHVSDNVMDLASIGALLSKYEFLLECSKKPRRQIDHKVETDEVLLPMTMPVINRTRFYYDLDALLQTVIKQSKCLQIQIDSVQSVEQILQLLMLNLTKQLMSVKKIELVGYCINNMFDYLKFEEDINNITEHYLFIDLTQYKNIISQQNIINILTMKNLILINLSTMAFFSIESSLNLKVTASAKNKFNCFVMSTHLLTLPSPEGKIKEDYGPYLNLLDSRSDKNRILVTSRAGLGKSRLCIELQKYFYDNKVYNFKQYDFVFLIELCDILPEDMACYADSYLETLYNILIKKHKLSKITRHELDFLAFSLNTGRVLLLFDGLDEILAFHLIKCKQLFEHLFSYSHFIVTSRPDVHLPFTPTEIISLNQFDQNKIIETINHYYHSKSYRSRLSENNFNMIFPPKLIELLSIPLYCRLFCESYLQHDKLPSYEDLMNVTKLSIYQTILLNDLRSYLVKKIKIDNDSLKESRKVLQLTNVVLKRLTYLAFQQMGLENKAIHYEEKIDNELNDLGFVKVEYRDEKVFCRFRHQTYMEYCAALYIAKGLCSHKKTDDLQQLIIKYRYDGRFEVLWQFIARILIDEDPFLIDKHEQGLEKFCKALVVLPRDIIGNRHNQLIKNCFSNDDLDKLKYCSQYFIRFKNFKMLSTPSSDSKNQPHQSKVSQPTSEMLFSNALNIFKNDTLDYRKDIMPFIKAYEKFISTKSHDLQLKVIDFAIDFLNQGLFLDKNRVILFKAGMKRESSWKNKSGMLLMAIAKMGLLSKHQKNQEEFIIKSLCELFKQTTNSNALDGDLLTALGDFQIFSVDSIQHLLNELLKTTSTSFFKSIVKCLNQSNVDGAKIFGVIKDNINTQLSNIRFCSIILSELLGYPFSDKNYLIITFIKVINNPVKSVADFVAAIDFVAKVAETILSEQARSIVMRLFAIIDHPDMSMHVTQYEKTIDLIRTFLIKNDFNFQLIELQLKKLFNRKGWRTPIIKLLAEFDALNSAYVDQCIAQENDKSDTAQAFVNLPNNYLNERVLNFIITQADEYFIWDALSQIFDRKYDITILPQELKDIIVNKAIQKLKSAFNIEKVLYVLSFILDKYAIERLYVESVPRFINYRKTDLIIQFSEMTLQYAWRKFCNSYYETRNQPLSSNWYFVILADYVEKNNLAVAFDSISMMIYSATGNHIFKIDSDLTFQNEVISVVMKYFSQLRAEFFIQSESLLNKLLRREEFEQSLVLSKSNLLSQVQTGLFYHKKARGESTIKDTVGIPNTLHKRGYSS